LITVRGTQCLAQADLVLYDYLINVALLEYAPATAERVCLGHPHHGRAVPQPEVNERMVAAARAGQIVVRLKSGDPHVFGRGAEEVEALVAAGIPFEVVPGVTAAAAAASHAGIPLTHRDLASAVAFITGHRRADTAEPAWDYQALAQFPGTLVFYMGMSTAPDWSAALVRGGRAAVTPVAIVRRASWADQEATYCTLGTVAQVIEQRGIEPPAVIIVGEVVALAPSIPPPLANGSVQPPALATGGTAAADAIGSTRPKSTGVIVISHGSPRAAANRSFLDLVERLAGQLPEADVVPAFFSSAQPDLPEQVAALAARNVRRILVMPYFLFAGLHVAIDIPNLLAECSQRFPHLTLELLPTLEDDPALEELLVERLTRLAAETHFG
jgi:uroporphyrin-III C-methyltransferase